MFTRFGFIHKYISAAKVQFFAQRTKEKGENVTFPFNLSVLLDLSKSKFLYICLFDQDFCFRPINTYNIESTYRSLYTSICALSNQLSKPSASLPSSQVSR